MKKTGVVGISKKALEIVKRIDKERKAKGLSSSVSAVATEAVVKAFSENA